MLGAPARNPGDGRGVGEERRKEIGIIHVELGEKGEQEKGHEKKKKIIEWRDHHEKRGEKAKATERKERRAGKHRRVNSTQPSSNRSRAPSCPAFVLCPNSERGMAPAHRLQACSPRSTGRITHPGLWLSTSETPLPFFFILHLCWFLCDPSWHYKK